MKKVWGFIKFLFSDEDRRFIEYGMVVTVFGISGILGIFYWLLGGMGLSMLTLLSIMLASYAIYKGWSEYRSKLNGELD